MRPASRCTSTLWCVALCLLAACGTRAPSIAEPSTEPATPATEPATTVPATTEPTTTSGPVEYEAIAGVLASAEHGPQLCLGGMLESLPPQCGGADLTNWDWSSVDGAQSVSGTTWIDRVLVKGHFDGAAFTVTDERAPSDADMARLERPYTVPTTPCPEPPGGWLAQAANASPTAMLGMDGSVGTYVASQPDSGGWWVDQSINPAMGDPAAVSDGRALNDPQKLIVVATFTGDLARHEADLRQLWPGALCVGKASISARDLTAIAKEINAKINRAGRPTLTLPNGVTLDLLSFSDGGNAVTGTVDYDVVIADPAAQAYFDETYGVGRIVLNPALHPVSAG